MYLKQIIPGLLLCGLLSTAASAQFKDQSDKIAFIPESGLELYQIRASDNPGGWWSARYLIDYALVAGGTTGYAIGKDLVPREKSMIGPTYDPDNFTDLFNYDEIGEPYLEQDMEESVPEYWIHRSIAASGAFLIGMEWMEKRNGRGSSQQIHDTFIGYAEAVAINAAVTELLKPVFARLRPDFRERALRFHCQDADPQEYGAICSDYFDRPLHEDPDEARDLLEDGRKSFYSGHSSNAFALFGYTSLAIGGRYVWGDDITRRSRIAGITAQAGLMSFAAYISASRVRDGRHFTSDTIVGTASGLAIANLSYWRRFDSRGSLRRDNSGRSGVTATPYFSPGAATGIRLDVRFN